jgi:hypothetical protein
MVTPTYWFSRWVSHRAMLYNEVPVKWRASNYRTMSTLRPLFFPTPWENKQEEAGPVGVTESMQATLGNKVLTELLE